MKTGLKAGESQHSILASTTLPVGVKWNVLVDFVAEGRCVRHFLLRINKWEFLCFWHRAEFLGMICMINTRRRKNVERNATSSSSPTPKDNANGKRVEFFSCFINRSSYRMYYNTIIAFSDPRHDNVAGRPQREIAGLGCTFDG